MQGVARMRILVDVVIDLLTTLPLILPSEKTKTKPNKIADFHSCTLTAKM